MTGSNRRCDWLFLVALVFATTAAGSVARAQVGDDEDEPDVPAQPQQVFMMGDEAFDQWVFGGGRNSVGGQRRLEQLLTLQIDDVDRTCGLSEAQKKKLLLAGRGDIKRFFDRVDDKRRRFQLVKNDQNKIGEIFQEIQPLQLSLNTGLYGDGSIFAKTLRNTLSAPQSAKYDTVLRDKKRFRYRAKVDLTVAMLDKAVGFRADQRRKLAELLLEETRPPRVFSQNDYWVVLLQASKLPEAKLKPLFDDVQWRLLKRQLDNAKGMEGFLQNGGFLPAGAVIAMPAVRIGEAVEVRAVEVKAAPNKLDEKKKDKE